MKNSMCMTATGLIALAALTGCQIKGSDGGISTINATPAPKAAPAPAKVADAPAPAKAAPAPAMSGNTVYLPTGRAESSVLRLERICPSEVVAGAEYEYEIKVTNISPVNVSNVEVSEAATAGFSLSSSTPAMDRKVNEAGIYKLDDLAAGASKSVKIKGKAGNTGQIVSCATATWVIPACCTVNVVAPALKITKTAPAEVGLCDTIPVQIVVTNSGTGVARNVVVSDKFPADMMTADGKNIWEMNVGNLASGESKTLNFTTKVSKVGSYNNSATANADGGLSASSNTTTTVVKNCNLEITKTGPANLYIGRDATYTITVRNSGNGVAKSAVVEDAVPAGTSFRSATEGGSLVGNVVTWNLGDLAAGASKTMTVTVNSGTSSEIRNSATVRSTCCANATANVVTAVEGVPAIVVELIDNPDPIETNGETTFTIVITNQGNRADSNLRAVFTLAPGLTFVSGSGESAVTNNGQTVTLGAIGTLAPKQVVRWTVRAKNTAANGDSRSNLSVTTDYFKNPIVEIESTNLVK